MAHIYIYILLPDFIDNAQRDAGFPKCTKIEMTILRIYYIIDNLFIFI